MDNLAQNIFEQATQDARIAAAAVQEGMKIGQREAEALRAALRAILAAWHEDMMLPTPLMCALASAKALKP